jgi:hypothetical protein
LIRNNVKKYSEMKKMGVTNHASLRKNKEKSAP